MKFKDAIKYSVQVFSSPEFVERIKTEDPKMVKHLLILKKINANGFLTTESQGGHKWSGTSVVDGQPTTIIERAYLSGFMLETTAAAFIKNIGLLTDKNAIYVPPCNDNIHLPVSLDIPVTVTKTKHKYVITTHMSVALPQSVWQSYRKQAHINKTEKVVYIQCWDPKWNNNASSSSGLFTDVLRTLKNLKKNNQ